MLSLPWNFLYWAQRWNACWLAATGLDACSTTINWALRSRVRCLCRSKRPRAVEVLGLLNRSGLEVLLEVSKDVEDC